MTKVQSVLIRNAAIAAWVLCMAGCASVPVDHGGSLPDPVIVNDPAEGPDLAEAELPPPLSVPEQNAPIDDAGPPEPIAYGDVFDRIRENLALPEAEHRRIESEIAWLKRNPDYLARAMGRAQRYLHYIVDEVEARGLPGELALLPFVESAFNPYGYSRSQAAGLWQFIAPTGELYGLKRNYWQDQRRDVPESTRAALQFLMSLYQRFDGDWFLAIAAYNYGAGNVQRAINRNRALRRHTDFFSLSLPAETRAYVPKLIAIARIVQDPAAYGLFISPIPDAPYFRVIQTDGPVDLRLMAQLAGVDTEELHALNPSWNRWVTDPDGPHRMLIPEVVADGFVVQLATLDGPARAGLGIHTVAAGESIASVAGHYKVPETYLKRINAGAATDLQPGQELLVPVGSVAQLRDGLGADLERRIYRVRPGDSLWSISRRNHMSVSRLARMNGISTSAVLHPGQRLQVSGAAPASETMASAAGDPPASGHVKYTVRSGDTLSEIARRFAVTVRQLQGWNNMGSSTTLRAGQRLTIRVGNNTGVGG
ncbi:MAG: LysM peptidoglycan-binding domain-containing protein [Gammaproteobacteria bacterium]|nr:LysM peptidoglycan-binding domain-containing protein [Gammaproteobacteria bacterium]